MKVHAAETNASERSETPGPQPEQVDDELDDETGLDKTIADSFPASDPPSSIPDPDEEDESAA